MGVPELGLVSMCKLAKFSITAFMLALTSISSQADPFLGQSVRLEILPPSGWKSGPVNGLWEQQKGDSYERLVIEEVPRSIEEAARSERASNEFHHLKQLASFPVSLQGLKGQRFESARSGKETMHTIDYVFSTSGKATLNISFSEIRIADPNFVKKVEACMKSLRVRVLPEKL